MDVYVFFSLPNFSIIRRIFRQAMFDFWIQLSVSKVLSHNIDVYINESPYESPSLHSWIPSGNLT